MLRIEYAYMTHPGNCRTMNQDNLVCMGEYLPRIHDRTDWPVAGSAEPDSCALFGVFDGMGGGEQGETAAWIAAKTAAETDIRDSGGMTRFCGEANRKICRYAKVNRIRSIGTTASMLLFDGNGAYSCHIGDSRIYRCDYGIPEQLTHDDAWPSLPGRKPALLQCLGIPESEMRILPHVDYYPILARSVFMICTDGLTDMLTENRIAGVLSDGEGLEKQTRTLLNEALEAGGRDNITLLLIRASPLR